MKKFVRTVFAGVALAMPLTLLATTPAVAANADVAVINGNGTILPGLDVVPVPQAVSFTGTANVTGSHPGIVTCSFNGTDLLGSLAEGVGTVSGDCGPIDLNTCAFVRVVEAVVVGCVDGVVEAGGGVCLFQATDSSPVKNYTLLCAALYV